MMMRLPVSGHVMPCTGCLDDYWIENVGVGQLGVFDHLVLCRLLGCWTRLG